MNEQQKSIMKELVERLNKATFAYEQENREIMSNKEFDWLYDKLKDLEISTGFILPNSPTQRPGYEVVSSLEKTKHKHPILSLDKTKSIEKISDWLEDNEEAFLSWKLDGLTVVLTYEKGILTSAVTRGDGEIGEDVLHNVKQIKNVPEVIDYKDTLTLRAEGVISYDDFNIINSRLPVEDQYKNPRNLASGSIRQLDSSKSVQRRLQLIVFEVIEGFNHIDSKTMRLFNLPAFGFDVVDYQYFFKNKAKEGILNFKKLISSYPVPTDGLVLSYDSIEYSKSLGSTSKHPKHAIAFKWEDNEQETVLRDIEWNTSRMGGINPVAIFDPVELEGTTVTRASLHNVSILENLELGIGDKITIYKANMIIPQIANNLTRSNSYVIPTKCPDCNEKATIVKAKDTKTLVCTNDHCSEKKIEKLIHYCSKDAMDIKGLSKRTIEDLYDNNCLKTLADIYLLKNLKDVILELDGFGEKSFNNMIKAIDNKKEIDMHRFLYALGIPNVGRTASKDICKHFKQDFDKVIGASIEELLQIDGVGEVISKNFVNYFASADAVQVDVLLKDVSFKQEVIKSSNSNNLDNTIFVITGKVNHFKNRKELATKIEELGGKVTGSVSSNTDYLINNDLESTSGKNKMAKELNVPIITEVQLLEMIQTH